MIASTRNYNITKFMQLPSHWSPDIKKYIESCDPSKTPKVCKMLQTKEGCLRIENLITAVMLINGIGIDESLHRVEMELTNNNITG
jgi:hypothetical protein